MIHLSQKHLASVAASGLRAWFAWTDSPKFSVLASGVEWDGAPSRFAVGFQETTPRGCHGEHVCDPQTQPKRLDSKFWSTRFSVRYTSIELTNAPAPHTRFTLRGRDPDPPAKSSTAAARTLAAQVQAWLQGNPAPLPMDALDLTSLSPFSRHVLTTLQKTVPRGQVATYGALAAACGMPGAARAVGNALRHNPFPLFLPCHRVIPANGRIGRFQGGPDGSPLKARLLAIEGVTRKRIE